MTRGQAAKVFYENAIPKRRVAAAMASHLVEAARLAGPAANELGSNVSDVLKGSNYALFKTRAKAAAGLVQRFREAADDFNERWVKDTDNSTYSTETDPTTLHNTYAQFIVICDAVLDGIRKLP